MGRSKFKIAVLMLLGAILAFMIFRGTPETGETTPSVPSKTLRQNKVVRTGSIHPAEGNTSADNKAPDQPNPLRPGVHLDLQSGEVTLSEGISGIDANARNRINTAVLNAFDRLDKLDSRHSEVVESNLRTDVIIIGKAGEEGQKIKQDLRNELLGILPKGTERTADLLVNEVAEHTADFGSKYRAIYTQKSDNGFKFVIGSFNDSLVSDFETFKNNGSYKDISNARSSISFTAPKPPFYLKQYFEP
jgi:hypothetical protein